MLHVELKASEGNPMQIYCADKIIKEIAASDNRRRGGRDSIVLGAGWEVAVRGQAARQPGS